MLRELHISNLAVISDARIELAGGLNCFTGATGAGKSLVIGAIEVLLGLRSAAEMLRPGAEEGRISGIFDIRNKTLLARIEQLTDIPITGDGGELLLTRRLYASGRGSISLNGNPITLAMLKNVAEHLIDVHGQHDHQYLLKPANQLDVLDQFGATQTLRNRYSEVYGRLQAVQARLDDLSANRSLRQQQLELYRFQAAELDTAELDEAEYEELQSRASVLTHLEKLKKEAGATHAALYEADGSILERLKMASAVLSELAGLDVNLKPISEPLRDATIALEEVAFDLSRYLDKLDLDPGELIEVNDRLNTIHRALNKYGDTVSAALAFRADLAAQIADLEKETGDLTGLHKQITPLLKELKEVGEELTARRRSAAQKLIPLIEKNLADLGMEKAKFSISFAPAPGALADDSLPAGPSGFDQIEFIAQTNPGQLPQPLRKIASGGEMSRIMLALKGILAQGDRISVLVFDEIDANVGGRLGSVIGNKLRRLAESHQVLCITHLPQIASYAERHLTVRKEMSDGQTQTRIRIMEGPERLEELAEMIGGRHITPITRAQAQEMLDAAQSEPNPSSSPVKIPSQTPSIPKSRARRIRRPSPKERIKR